jgi:hypothetical protein|tara:strand:+ start:235 stop:2307 length:2073 start_codon:yes stop_codon:yes gene_type:complete
MAAPARALADGSSGTIGAQAVGAHELRDGSVGTTKMAQISSGRVLGRGVLDGTGTPQLLTPPALRDIVATASDEIEYAGYAAAEAARPPASIKALRLAGYFSAGDGGGAVYRRVASEPSHEGKLQTVDGTWWELAETRISPLMFGALGDGVTDDSEAFHKVRTYAEQSSLWRWGYMVTPSVLDLHDRIYALNQPVWIRTAVRMINGRILLRQSALQGDYGVRLGEFDSGASYKQVLENVEFVADALTGYCPAALLEVPRCFGGRFVNVMCFAGRNDKRARYGFFLAGQKGWSLTIQGGRFYGGDCPLRIGRSSDHTGLVVMPEVIEHGQVCNLMLCNPKGAKVVGRMEHAFGKFNIVITSGTNGSSDVADNVTIEDGYLFNDSQGIGLAAGNCQILAGHDVPGTEGWDQVGPITSGGVNGLHLRNLYAVSSNIQANFRLNVFRDCIIENIKWVARGWIAVRNTAGSFQSGEALVGSTSGATGTIHSATGQSIILQATIGTFQNGETLTGGSSGATAVANTADYFKPRLAEFEGSCVDVWIRAVANQNTGSTLPAFSSTSTRRIHVDISESSFIPAVKGANSPGSYTVVSSSGSWQVTGSLAHLNGHVEWSGASGSQGPIGVVLHWIAGLGVQPAVASVATTGFGTVVQALMETPGAPVRLQNAAKGTSLTSMPAAGSIHFSLSVPVDLAD